jgi:hypothetical protein
MVERAPLRQSRPRIFMVVWMWRRLVLSVGVSLSLVPYVSPGSSRADDRYSAAIVRFVQASVDRWLADRLIVASLKASNAEHRRLTDKEIGVLDRQWQQELDADVQPLIEGVLSSPLSDYLRQKEIEASGAIGEILVMDARGLNVGVSGVTSDYWQGDEEKFRLSYQAGANAVFVDEPIKDESAQVLLSQVSMTIVDEQNRPIGAITVGVNLDQF